MRLSEVDVILLSRGSFSMAHGRWGPCRNDIRAGWWSIGIWEPWVCPRSWVDTAASDALFGGLGSLIAERRFWEGGWATECD